MYCIKKILTLDVVDLWCPHHDSNVELLLRTELFYPLNYGGKAMTQKIMGSGG
jgi:hypothetical protein